MQAMIVVLGGKMQGLRGMLACQARVANVHIKRMALAPALQAGVPACCNTVHRAQAALRIAATLAWCAGGVLHLLSYLSA